MNIHNELTPVRNAPVWVKNCINDDEAMDGGFSRVVPVSPFEVVKFTSCEGTVELLQLLRKEQGKQALALPAVLENLGPCAKDADGVLYHGWLLERLFVAGAIDDMRRARVTGRAKLSRVKPAYQRASTLTVEPGVVHALQAALQGIQKERTRPDGNDTSADDLGIATDMAVRTTGILRHTFVWLSELLRKNPGMRLDLLTEGNLLVNMFGEPMLADPVIQDLESLQFGLAGCASAGVCLGVWLPTRVQGLKVELRPYSSQASSEDDLRELSQRLQLLGLRNFQEFHEGSKEHLEFLGAPPKKAPIWELPDVARHLRDDSYIRTLCA